MLIAIIGHGRSPEGQSWGGRIDSCDAIVRMWDWHWQEPDDYGERYDWGVIEVHPDHHRRWLEYNCREPTQGWIASFLCWRTRAGRKITKDDVPPRTQVVNQARWTNPVRAHGYAGETGNFTLTRAGIAACWVIERSRPDDRIILVGCDNLREGIALPLEQAFPPIYRRLPSTATFDNYQPGKTRPGNHNFAGERLLIQQMAERRSMELVFAQDVWA